MTQLEADEIINQLTMMLAATTARTTAAEYTYKRRIEELERKLVDAVTAKSVVDIITP